MSFYRNSSARRHFRPALHPSDAALIQRRKQEAHELSRARIRAQIAAHRSAAVSAASSATVPVAHTTLQNGENQHSTKS